MGDVHVAPTRHHCSTMLPDRPIGSIYRCSCGRYWWAFDTDGCAPPSAVWTPVRWFNFRKLRVIRQAGGEQP